MESILKSNGLKMQWISIPKPVIVIVGPTGVGKSVLAIQIAREINAEIVSADSRLFYKGMDIGTAKPTQAMQILVPHHLIDVATPDQTWSLAVFQNEAKKAIDQIHQKGKIAILVGGTGQYIRAVLEEWSLPPIAPDHLLRNALEEWAREIGKIEIHSKLAYLDPEAARVIDPANLRRTIRALEVILLTGKKFSEQRKKGNLLYNTITFGLTRSRQELYDLIDQRIEKMLAEGFLEEVERLLKEGYTGETPALSAIGYKQLIQYLHGEITYDQAIVEIKRMTRVFVRRQSNWFRLDDPGIHWVNADDATLATTLSLIKNEENWKLSVKK